MPDSGRELGLADFTGLLIDGTLSALIKSLESQVQWREQLIALGQLSDSALQSTLTMSDVLDWIGESYPPLEAAFERWQELEAKAEVDLGKEAALTGPFMRMLAELEIDGLDTSEGAIVMDRLRFDLIVDRVKTRLAVSARQRLTLMKEMGLPALVAERVEIKAKMNLQSSAQGNGADESNAQPRASATRSQSKLEPSVKESAGPRTVKSGTEAFARPVRADVVARLSDLDGLRTRVEATKTHSISVTTMPIIESSGEQYVNAEISIVLRSHFF